MEKDVDYIIYWEEVTIKCAKFFTEQNGFLIARENILEAIFIVLEDKKGYDWIPDIYDEDFSREYIIEILKDFDFKKLNNSIETNVDIVHKDLLRKYKVKIKAGLIWIIHKYDKDPFPSNPHAHNLDNNLKLHLGNGICFRKRTEVDKITKKNLLEIRNKIRERMDIEIPMLEV